jgi:hypothetical protein
MADETGDAASTPIGSGKKRSTGRQASVQRLSHSHFKLLGLHFPDHVDERSRRGGQDESFAPNRVDLFIVRASVDYDAGWTAQTAVATPKEQVDRVGNDVAEVE